MKKVVYEIPENSTEDTRSKIVGKAIEMVWQSLESHLITPYYSNKKYTKEDKKFHQQCVRDYAELIKLISQLY